MAAKIVDGKKIAQGIEDGLKTRVAESGRVPGLVSVIVGGDPSSHKFVDLKAAAAERVGMNFEKKAYPENFDPRLIINYIREKNADDSVDGIIVQLPLPDHFERVQILKSVHPFKDVDCLHPKNLGLLMMGAPVFVPPVVRAIHSVVETPRRGVSTLRGKRITVVGAGLLVGRPLAVFLMNMGATVTVVNEFTKNLAQVTRETEVVISATGVKSLITAEHVAKGAMIIDAANDVDTDSVSQKVSVLVPSPGGIGPLTIAYLLQNTFEVFARGLAQN